MSKKMKRELKNVDDTFESVKRMCKEIRVNPHSSIVLHYTQKRADIANKIGRKSNGKPR